jgi:hypothetical protein
VAAPAATPAPFDTPSYQAAAPQPERVAPAAQTAANYGGTAVAAQSSGYAANSVATRPSGYAAASVASQASGYAEVPAVAEASGYTANPVAPQQTARLAVTTRPPLTATGQPTVAAAAAPQADPFEPPPPGMSAAQMQARAAGAVSPGSVPTAQASTYNAVAGSANQQTAAARAEPPTVAARAPDPIDAAADAFEPPPPASVAARQAQQARQTDGNGGVQIMRASTASRGIPAPTQTTDDPIARFANGNF